MRAGEQKVYVFIYLPGEYRAVPAGILTRDSREGVGNFAYGRRYLRRSDALPVDPVSLPLSETAKDVRINNGIPGAIRDASPDYWGRLVAAAEAKTVPEAMDEFDFLLLPGATRVGCLDFRQSLEEGEPDLAPPSFQDLDSLLDAAELLQKGEPVREDVLRLFEQGTSVGGARPKCTVEMEEALWIAKFPSRGDSVNQPRIEYATMQLAKRCGIAIPELRMERSGEREFLLVKRFDRKRVGASYLRSGFLSALSLMEWDENDRHLWSYPELADRMRSAFLAGPDSLQQLFRRMVFHILCRNTDDHPRNHGFLFGEKGYALSPAYDITPTLTRKGVNTNFSLAMTVGTRGREASLENALSLSPRFGLRSDEAKLLVKDLVEGVSGWENLFQELGVSARDREIVAPSFFASS